MVAMQGPSMEMDCMTRFGEVWRTHRRGRQGHLLLGERERRGWKSSSDDELRSRFGHEDLLSERFKEIVKECTWARGGDGY
jgi:hypothetical protein